MKVKIAFQLFFVMVLASDSDMENEQARKHYGLSYHVRCDDYVKSFTCMSACKSIGFQVFRMDNKCKCSCHELKTTTILPFFKWRTNGTVKKWHRTYSIPLYHIVGTLSPPSELPFSGPVNETTPPQFDCRNFTAAPDGNITMSNDTNFANATEESEGKPAEAGGAPPGESKGEPGGADAGGADAGKPDAGPGADPGAEPAAPAEGDAPAGGDAPPAGDAEEPAEAPADPPPEE